MIYLAERYFLLRWYIHYKTRLNQDAGIAKHLGLMAYYTEFDLLQYELISGHVAIGKLGDKMYHRIRVLYYQQPRNTKPHDYRNLAQIK